MPLSNNTIPVFQVDESCVILDCNSKACEFSGLKYEDMKGRHLYDFLQSNCKLSDILTGERDYAISRFYRSSGIISEVVVMVDNVVRQEKRIYYMSIFDVSANGFPEDDIRRENIKLLVGHVAHAFYNILSVILGSLSVLREEVDTREQFNLMLDNAESGAIRARHLTGRMLTFSRGEIIPVSRRAESQSSRQKRLFPGNELNNGRLLFLDDNPFVADTAIGMLCTLGYCVDVVSEGKAALNKYGTAMRNGNPYGAVILNLATPEGMGGTEVIKFLLEMDPDAVVILSSGFAGSDIMRNYSSFGFKAVLPKPYTVRELFESLNTALGQ